MNSISISMPMPNYNVNDGINKGFSIVQPREPYSELGRKVYSCMESMICFHLNTGIVFRNSLPDST